MEEQEFINNKRGKWSELGVPHKGWKCIEIEDSEDISTTCEMCESQSIRYIHYMKHPNYDKVLKVGCICAGHMEEDLIAAKKRDDFMKSRSSKRTKWLNRNWKKSIKGNEYIKADGYIITIFFKNNNWQAVVSSENGDFKKFSKKKYNTSNEIKIASFDLITKLLSEKQ